MKAKKANKKDQQKNKEGKNKQPDAAMQRDIEADKREHVKEAREQADIDITQDADLSLHSTNDDLDEGETARLGEDITDVV